LLFDDVRKAPCLRLHSLFAAKVLMLNHVTQNPKNFLSWRWSFKKNFSQNTVSSQPEPTCFLPYIKIWLFAVAFIDITLLRNPASIIFGGGTQIKETALNPIGQVT